MSSILDALRKLENEKAQQADETSELPLNPEIARRELTGRSGLGPGVEFRITPIRMAIALAVLIAAVGTVTAVAGRRLFEADQAGATAPLQTVSSAVPGEAFPSASREGHGAPELLTESDEPMMPFPAPAVSILPSQPSSEMVENPIPVPPPIPPVRPSDRPGLAPDSEVHVRPVIPVPVPSSPETPARRASSGTTETSPKEEEPLPSDVDMKDLPYLTISDRSSLGLPELKVRMASGPSQHNPKASALIEVDGELHRVRQGDTIGLTSARLVAADTRGIGIEVAGKLYYVSAR